MNASLNDGRDIRGQEEAIEVRVKNLSGCFGSAVFAKTSTGDGAKTEMEIISVVRNQDCCRISPAKFISIQRGLKRTGVSMRTLGCKELIQIWPNEVFR